MAVDFCDYFWGEEHNGWNVLYQNMKQGHNASKELAEYFKERWSIDESYCKALLKLSNKASVNSEKGTLTPLFSLLKTSSEKMSTIHLHMVNRIQDLVKDIVKYNEELHKKQKQIKDEESQTEDVMKNIQATSGLALKAKEVYSQRCQDLEKVKRDGASPKEVEKAESKLRKAHDEYKSFVEKYNIIRDEFEKRMLHSCKRFQSVEETHLSQILLFVQTYIYVLQTDQNAMGQILQELMNKYSEFTIDKLLDTFALSKLTGLEKPVTMVFEDTSSLGSAISGQQSPEPADQSKSSADDASSVGGGEKASSGGVLTGGFLRSRRDKRKDKKAKKKKTEDSLSNKEEKSDNENSEEAKTVDLLSIGVSPVMKDEAEVNHTDKSVDGDMDDGGLDDSSGLDHRHQDSSSLFDESKKSFASSGGFVADNEEPSVDEDGYTIRPQYHKGKLNKENSFDSSSDSDSEIGIEKKIHVEIKPITNGTTPISASVDELRATIEGMSLSPLGFISARKTASDIQDSSGMKRSSSITHQIGSSSADLFGLNLSFHASSSSPKPTITGNDSIQDGSNSNGSRKNSLSQSHKISFSPISTLSNQSSNSALFASKRIDRYSELTEILVDGSNSESVPPVLPPRSCSSRGSTPTPTMAIPRPSSRKSTGSRAVQSPATVSTLSRAESISSLEFRTSSIPTGFSRGPSPLTIGMSDTIPLAVAFQELCHAYFRGTDESRIQMKVTGEMMVSFPAGIVGVLANNPSPAQLSFKVQNFNRMVNPLSNQQLITYDDSQSTDDCGVYNFNMSSLSSLLRKQAEQNPTASYFNVDIIKYQVGKLDGAESSPLHLVSYWRCEDSHTDLRVDYRYNGKAMSNISPLLNICVSVPIDGVVKNMQSKPTGQWLKDQQKAVWKLTELSQHSSEGGKGSLRGKFEVAAGPSTPTTVSAQFNCEGTTLSGVEFALSGAGYRISLVKKRFVSGKYICDADAVLRHRYGSITS